MAAVQHLENELNKIFVGKAPTLPKGGKKFLVDIAPWAAIVIGVLDLWSAWMLWHWAHTINSLVNYANNLAAVYGSTPVIDHGMTVVLWLAMLVILVDGLLYLFAFPRLRQSQKSGWNLIFYAALLNIAYGFVVMFTSYGSFFSFVWSLIEAAIVLYFLFQIRASYVGHEFQDNLSDKPAGHAAHKP